MADILVVEAYKDIRLLLSTALERSGHEVHAVADGQRALAAMSSSRYDCVIVGSPVVVQAGGRRTLLLQFLGEHHPELCRSIVMITTHAENLEVISLATRLNVYAVLAKPFSTRDLREIIDACTAGRPPKRRWFGIPDAVIEEALAVRIN